MLGPTEASPSTERAALPHRSNEDNVHLMHAVDSFPKPWGRKEIPSSGFTARPARNLRQKRRQALLVAFGALAVTFAVLRCAVQRGPHREAGDDARSLVAGRGSDAPATCIGGRGGGFERRGAARETLSEQGLQLKASAFMSSFVTIVKNNEPVLARIPVQTRSKILSLLLTLVVQELAALASVLDDSSRAILVQTVREVGVITRRLGMTITRRTGGICSRRLQLYLASVLQRLEVSGPQGSRLPLGERLQKLHDLLRLQEVMVVNLSAVFNNLTRGFSSGNDPDDEALLETKNKLGDLLHIRKEHIFMDALLSRWLLESENRSRRFAVASPAHLLHLRRRERPTVEEMLQELLTLSVAGREQSTITEHFPQLEEAEAHIPESSELPPAGEDLLATEVPTVLLGDPLGSGEVVQVPNTGDQTHSLAQSGPAAWEGRWGLQPHRQVVRYSGIRSTQAFAAPALHHTQVAASSTVFSLIPIVGWPFHAWPAVDTRFLATGYSPQEPLQEGVLGSAAGEPLPRAATQQESAEEAISNPFNFPDIFEHLRRGLASPPE